MIPTFPVCQSSSVFKTYRSGIMTSDNSALSLCCERCHCEQYLLSTNLIIYCLHSHLTLRLLELMPNFSIDKSYILFLVVTSVVCFTLISDTPLVGQPCGSLTTPINWLFREFNTKYMVCTSQKKTNYENFIVGL